MKLTLYIVLVLSCGLVSPLRAQTDTLPTQGWVRLSTGVSEPFYHLFVLNADTVYVTTNSALLRTRDGGTNWEYLITDAITRGCIWFMDDTTGIYAPTTDTIYKTVDGGEHWRAIYTGLDQQVVQQMQFVGYDTGWFRYEGTIVQTTDGGEHWIDRPTNAFSFSFATSKIGYAVTILPMDAVEKTIDGGTTWKRFTPRHDVRSYALFALSPDTLISPCCGDTVAKSVDSGHSWSLHLTGAPSMIFTGIAFANHHTGWAVSNQLIHTIDAGETWTLQHNPTGAILRGIGTADTVVAYAIGDSGVVLKTTNGGTAWVDVGPGWSPSLNNYVVPLPASTISNLSFELPTAQRVTITLYSITGTHVRTLVDNVIKPAGWNSLEIDVRSLEPGTYIYEIKGDHCYGTGKLIVVRSS